MSKGGSDGALFEAGAASTATERSARSEASAAAFAAGAGSGAGTAFCCGARPSCEREPPQLKQNLAPSGFFEPHRGQNMLTTLPAVRASRIKRARPCPAGKTSYPHASAQPPRTGSGVTPLASRHLLDTCRHPSLRAQQHDKFHGVGIAPGANAEIFPRARVPCSAGILEKGIGRGVQTREHGVKHRHGA